MDYTIDLSESKKYLIVKALGDFTVEISRRWAVDVAERSRELDVRRFLFDVRSAKNASSVFENYDHAYQDPNELDLPKNVRSAILISESDRSHDFVETAFRNAGINTRIFTEESAAVEWLEEGAG